MTTHAPALHFHSVATPAADGLVVAVSPQSAGWSYVGFEVYRLVPGQSLALLMSGRELCVVVLTGTLTAQCADTRWQQVGSRASVFDGPADSVYFQPFDQPVLTAESNAEVALCWAPAKQGVARRLLPASRTRVSTRGSGQTEREIRDILMMDEPAESLLVTEVVTPAGNWSSYPPHKHDTDDPPWESYLEETYYHRTRMANAFAVQRVYTADRSLDMSFAVGDGDVVLVPRGYHPVAAEPRSDLYYLNVMAGPRREWLVRTEPGHSA